MPRGDGQLGLKYYLLGLIPVRVDQLERFGFFRANVAGREVLIARTDDQRLRVGERIEPIALSEAWRRRLGSYELANPGNDHIFVRRVTLGYEDGVLFVSYPDWARPEMTIRAPLAPISDSEALMQAGVRGMGETVRVVTSGQDEALVYSGYVFTRRPR